MNEFEYRFSGIGKLYGKSQLETLRNSHVLIVGIGGVGTWVAEAIARTGIGEITLVDLDDVCVSNTNRQLVALTGEIGKQKVDVMKERIEKINPDAKVNAISDFFTSDTASEILNHEYSLAIDCIDSAKNKALMVAACKRKKLPLIVMGGAGGKLDLTKIKVSDLNKAKGDHLLKRVKELLIEDFNFPVQSGPFRIRCVYSDEERRYPQKDGTVCTLKSDDVKGKLDCATGFGTASFITGTFAFIATSEAIRLLLKND